MRIAIVHDWLVVYAGAERALEQMLACYPDADLFSLVDFLPTGQRDFIRNKPVTTSFIQRLPKARKKYRAYLPLMPLAVEQFDLADYDLVISSSHAVAKGVLTGPDQLHLCYCHSPIRYAWDLQHQYLKESGLDHGLTGWAAKIILHYIRMWDSRTANGVNAFAANSSYIARRIRKVYNRESTILFGPVDVANYTLCTKKKDYYVTVSRMVPYKKVDLIVEAFSSMPEKRLIVIGDGPDMPKVLAKAGPNVELVGFASAESMREYLQYARAFVFAAEEDFGLAPIEAQACGTPVIAFGKGGVLDTVRSLGAVENRPTGLFFGEQSATAIVEAVRRFERVGDVIKPEDCRDNAMLFSLERFRTVFKTFVEEKWQVFQQNKQGGL